MRTVLRASLRTHTRRYVSAAIAVVIGVSFIVVTSLLSDATRAGLVAGVEVPYRGADVVVTDVDADEAGRIVDRAEADGDSATVKEAPAPADPELYTSRALGPGSSAPLV